MTINTILTFIFNCVAHLAGSSLFSLVLLTVFAFFLFIILIRLVWYLVQFN